MRALHAMWSVLYLLPDLIHEKVTQKGIVIGYGSIRRFFEREGITRKKDADRVRAKPFS